MWDTDAVPYAISSQGADLLAKVMRPHLNCGYPWNFCKVQLHQGRVESIASEMVEIARAHGQPLPRDGKIPSDINEWANKHWPKFSLWDSYDLRPGNAPRYEPEFRQQLREDLQRAYKVQSLKDAYQRGYVIARDIGDQPYHTWLKRCHTEHRPLVVLWYGKHWTVLTLDLSSMHGCLTPEGVHQVRELYAKYTGNEKLSGRQSNECVHCISVPLEYAQEMAQELVKIGQTLSTTEGIVLAS